jgi:hypothetical protein
MAASMSAEQILEQIFESDDELPEKLDGEVDKNVFSIFFHSSFGDILEPQLYVLHLKGQTGTVKQQGFWQRTCKYKHSLERGVMTVA